MDRWFKLKYLWLVVGLIFSTIILAQNAEAIGPNNLECVETGNGIICPDLYCATSTINCDTTGQQCYCQPSAFGRYGDLQNTYCEFATGSEMLFARDKNGDVDKIYLKNGVWGSIVDQIKTIFGSGNDIDIANRAIVFNRTDKISDDGSLAYYSSNFLSSFRDINKFNAYYSSYSGYDLPMLGELKELLENNRHVGMGFFAKIEKGADSGYVYNQMFELGDNKSKQLCGNHVFEQGNIFYHKASGVAGKSTKETACLGTSSLVLGLLMPSNEKATGPLNIDRGILNSVQLTRNCFGFKLGKGFLGISKDETIIDATLMVSNLIVPTNTQRTIYQVYQENYYMGTKFDKEDHSSRDEKVKKIQEQCATKCKINYSSFDHKLPGFCNSCNYLATALKNNPNKSLSEIIGEELGESTANCSIINPSFGHTLKNKNSTNYNYKYNDEDIVYDNKSEKRINRLIPDSLGKICENTHGNDKTKRINCKVNSLNCYVEAISPELQGKDVCDFMNKTESFRRGRWIFCPVLKTGTNAADSIQKTIEEIFAINSNVSNDTRIKKVWENVRNIANIVLVIALIITILSHITGFGLSNYQIKTALPKILVGAILINTSFVLSQLGITLSTMLGDGIKDILNNILAGAEVPQITFESTIFKSSGSILVIAGILALALPMLGIILFSVVGLLLILSMRQTILIFLIILSPLAFAVATIPSGQGLSKKWFKAYLAMISIYPVTQMMYSASTLTKALLSGAQREGAAGYLMPLIANSLPYLAILIIPFVVKSLFNASAKMASKLTSGTDTLTGGMQQRSARRSQSSFFRRAARDYSKKSLTNFAIGNTQRRRAKAIDRAKRSGKSPNFKTYFDNPFLNFISSGAVGDLAAESTFAAGRSEQIKTMGLIGDDAVLLQALIEDNGKQGEFYQSLNKSRQDQYLSVVNQNHGRGFNINTVTPILLAKNGVTDKELYQKAFKNAEESGVDKNSYIGIAYGMAKKNGDVELMAFLKAQMKLKERNVTASDSILSASKPLKTASFALRDAIVNSGGDLSKISAATAGLNPSDLLILEELKISGITKRDLISAAINVESGKTSYSEPASKNLITKGMCALAGTKWAMNGSKIIITTGEDYKTDAKGNVGEVSAEQAEKINYANHVLELVNQNLGNNGEGIKELGFSEVTGIFYVEQPKPPKDSNIKSKIKRIVKEGEAKIKKTVDGTYNIAEIINNVSEQSLPNGWGADYSDARLASEYAVKDNLAKEAASVSPDKWFAKLFDETRTADKNIGVNTTHAARTLIVQDIHSDIDLSGVAGPNNVKDRAAGHILYMVGLKWHSLAPNIRTAISNDIVTSIYNSMDKHGSKKAFGINSLDDAQKIGAVGMMELIGIKPEKIQR